MKLRTTFFTTLCVAGVALAGALVAQPPELGKSFLDRHDLDGDGQVTAAEFGSSHPIFQEFDEDGDGVVAATEIEARRAERQLRAAGHVARRADAEQDGIVTATEWAAWIGGLDADGDGIVGPEDLAPRCADGPCGPGGEGAGPGGGPRGGFGAEGRPARHHARPPGGPEPLLSVLDTDGDGELQVTELDAYFGLLDADGDGELAEDELPERGRRGFGPRRSRRG